MPKYLYSANYVGDGAKGLLKEGGTSRRAAIEQLVGSLGGTVEGVYYAFGDPDIFVIFDLPDQASAAALGMMVAASGVIEGHTTVLLTPEEVDEAAKKSPTYRPPGQ